MGWWEKAAKAEEFFKRHLVSIQTICFHPFAGKQGQQSSMPSQLLRTLYSGLSSANRESSLTLQHVDDLPQWYDSLRKA